MDYKDKEFLEAVEKETAKQMKKEIKSALDWAANNRKEASEKRKRGELISAYQRVVTAKQAKGKD